LPHPAAKARPPRSGGIGLAGQAIKPGAEDRVPAWPGEAPHRGDLGGRDPPTGGPEATPLKEPSALVRDRRRSFGSVVSSPVN